MQIDSGDFSGAFHSLVEAIEVLHDDANLDIDEMNKIEEEFNDLGDDLLEAEKKLKIKRIILMSKIRIMKVM